MKYEGGKLLYDNSGGRKEHRLRLEGKPLLTLLFPHVNPIWPSPLFQRTAPSGPDWCPPSLRGSWSMCGRRLRYVPWCYCKYLHLYIYTLQDVYTPLHLVPPTVHGLINAIENKYKISATNIRFLYRKNKDGIVAKVDDDMLRHYCNEDVFLMQVLEASFH